ncbi:MAG: hypothetical protein LBJ44_03900 [Propionibacteriaceae bacterium]|jgi:hypothetical protein|nr:hypothetical protein [Propionibacteriaceae bacterium]
MENGVPLSKAIEALRDELEQSMRAGEGRDLRFKVDEVKLELKVAATTDAAGKAGVKWFLFEAGGEVSHQSAQTQTVTLTLKAVTPGADGQPSEVLLSAPED